MKPNELRISPRVMRRFPDRSPRIARLLREDDEFAELCRDYEDSCVAADAWRGESDPVEHAWPGEPRRGGEQVAGRKDRYAELVRELEQEILDYLETEPSAAKGDDR